MKDNILLILPALTAGLLILASHVPLGRRVLQRGIIFIDIAIAQFAALGMVIIHVLQIDSVWISQLGALSAALSGALLFNLTERLWPQIQEAIIGSGFVVSSSLVILLLSYDPHGGEHLQELLVGQILWINWADLWLLGGMSLLALFAWFGLGLERSRAGFYLLFALLITFSVQLIGIYLVFASLILPALAGRQYSLRAGLAIAYAIGALAYIAGLMLSLWLDLPAGALIVCTLTTLTLSWLFLLHQRAYFTKSSTS
ncbi:MAG: metal ABC transporter permease [Thiohalomonadaceae bacterium]